MLRSVALQFCKEHSLILGAQFSWAHDTLLANLILVRNPMCM